MDYTALRPGDVVDGKYSIEGTIGTGGMGVVFAARHLQLDERVAIKFLLPHIATRPDAVTRFRREARAAVKIKSEHVCRVLDIDVTRSGATYIVMEHLVGETLDDLLEKRVQLPIDEAIDYVLQACHAVAEAHSRHIVHRDLKLGNLFRARYPNGAALIKVLDFGVAKLVMPHGGGDELTASNTMMGSLPYVSPEQLESPRDVDHRTDIWSLGVILQLLITGLLPFDASTPTDLVRKIKGAPPTPVAEYCPEVPPGLARLILRCLEKDRTKRFSDIAHLAVALGVYSNKSQELLGSIVGATDVARLDIDETLHDDFDDDVDVTEDVPEEAKTTPGYLRRGSMPPLEATVADGPLLPEPGHVMPVAAPSEQPPPSVAISVAPHITRLSRARWVAALGAVLVAATGIAGVVAVRGGWSIAHELEVGLPQLGAPSASPEAIHSAVVEAPATADPAPRPGATAVTRPKKKRSKGPQPASSAFPPRTRL